MEEYIWYDGIDNYKKCTFRKDPLNKEHSFCIELLDTDVAPYNNIFEVYNDLLHTRQTKFVDVLYSGGLDSELILYSSLIHNIPVRAITMRLIVNGFPVNLIDLYYSEKFCRANNIAQVLIDLDIEQFFESGRYHYYLKNYLITEPHVATHFWLLEQCTGFPVMGGDYTWPWNNEPLLSPHRHSYANFDRFLKEKNIHGIGNMMNHCAAGNLLLMKSHISLINDKKIETDYKNIPIFKKTLFERLGYKNPEIRMRSYGWEYLHPHLFNIYKYNALLKKEFGTTKNIIKWNNVFNSIINAEKKYNEKF